MPYFGGNVFFSEPRIDKDWGVYGVYPPLHTHTKTVTLQNVYCCIRVLCSCMEHALGKSPLVKGASETLGPEVKSNIKPVCMSLAARVFFGVLSWFYMCTNTNICLCLSLCLCGVCPCSYEYMCVDFYLCLHSVSSL
mgnify:CR=1 FL=1